MSRLIAIVIAALAVFVSPSAISAEVVGNVKVCIAPGAPHSPHTYNGGVQGTPQTKEPFFYQNANGGADDLLAIKMRDASASGNHFGGCRAAVRAMVVQNPHNEPIPVKGMKWHMVVDDNGAKVPLIAEALEDFVSVGTEGKIKICRRSGLTEPLDKMNVFIPKGSTFTNRDDSQHFVIAITEDATLGPKPKCATVGALLDHWITTNIQITRKMEPLLPQFEVDNGRGGATLQATVVEDFK